MIVLPVRSVPQAWSVSGLISTLRPGRYPQALLPLCVGQYPQINDDLVNSHHLLLCCLDMLYSAALTKRKELLQPQCLLQQQEPEQKGETSVLPQICQLYNGQ